MAKNATKTAKPSTENTEESGDAPLLDTLGAAVKKMVAKGKERGFVTYDELNEALPQDEVSSEQIEDTMTMLSEMGINVVENEESEEAAAPDAGEAEEAEAKPGKTGNVDDDIGRTDDPVRMYLREMGSVELLSREGEIAIAKRIEAGREMMIGGLCESSLTIRSIVEWHDALIEEQMLLRDIIDLETTYGGGPASMTDNSVTGGVGSEGQREGQGGGGENATSTEGTVTESAATEPAVAEAVTPETTTEEVAPTEEAATEAPAEGAEAKEGEGESSEGGEEGEGGEGGEGEGGENTENRDDDDEDEGEASLSLAAMEAKLKPEVIENFEKIASLYENSTNCRNSA